MEAIQGFLMEQAPVAFVCVWQQVILQGEPVVDIIDYLANEAEHGRRDSHVDLPAALK